MAEPHDTPEVLNVTLSDGALDALLAPHPTADTVGVRVFLSTRAGGAMKWESRVLKLSRMPAVGECVVIDGRRFEVKFVAHEDVADPREADVYAVEVAPAASGPAGCG